MVKGIEYGLHGFSRIYNQDSKLWIDPWKSDLIRDQKGFELDGQGN
jgi:hypothetical protein